MEPKPQKPPGDSKVPEKPSPVKVVISWLIEADREYRVAQSMVNERHDKL